MTTVLSPSVTLRRAVADRRWGIARNIPVRSSSLDGACWMVGRELNGATAIEQLAPGTLGIAPQDIPPRSVTLHAKLPQGPGATGAKQPYKLGIRVEMEGFL
jgi:hypothetical protein